MPAPPTLRKNIPLELSSLFDNAQGLSHGALSRAFFAAVGHLIASWDIEEIERQLNLYGNLNQWLETNPEAVAALAEFRQVLKDAFEGKRDSSGRRSTKHRAAIVQTFVSAADGAVRTSPIPSTWFSLERWTNEAIRFVENRSAARIVGIDQATREGIRAIISEAFSEFGTGRDGITRALVALDGSDGLRLGLDPRRSRTLVRWINENITPDIPAPRARKMIDRRYRQLLRQRAVVIAQTESVYTANAGYVEAVQLAVAEGQLDPNIYILEWVARVIRCPRCAAMDTSTREIHGGSFVSDGSGPLGIEAIAFPDLHPNGWCFIRTIRRSDALRLPRAA